MDKEWFKARKRQVKVTDQDLADAIGRDRSVVNRIVNGEVRFDLVFVDGFSRLLEVSPEELLSRVGVPSADNLASNANAIGFQGDNLEKPPENLPVWGSGLGADREVDGEAIEQTTLNTGEILEFVRRPAILAGKKGAYAIHVQGSSMHPALPEGEIVVACHGMPLSIGDNVVVYLRSLDEDDDGAAARGVLVKELVRRSASYVELRQYEPRKDFRIATADVLRIDRILTRREMIS
jgi:transcriptional regulator with XRE-family HTH domain